MKTKLKIISKLVILLLLWEVHKIFTMIPLMIYKKVFTKNILVLWDIMRKNMKFFF